MNKIALSALHAFTANVKKFPDNNAIHVAGKHYSYREFSNIISGVQKLINDSGFEDETLIGVLTIDDIYTYASMMAIMFNGGAYIPINNKNPLQRNNDIIKDTDLKLVLASVEHDAIKNADGDVTIVDTSGVIAANTAPQILKFTEDNLAYILFTSGSTGKPKGVPIKHRSLNAFLNVMLDEQSGYGFNPDDRFLQMFELTFDMSIASYMLPLCVGACCYVMPQQGISYMNIINLLDQHKITITQMVPSVLLYLERFFGELNFPNVRFSIFAGEGLPASVLPGWQKVVPTATIVNLYGPTEATVYCLRYDWHGGDPSENEFNGFVSIGRPWPGIDACIIDQQLKRIKQPATKGELCIKGAQLTDGYWNDPEKTAASFISIEGTDGTYYRTGDSVFINALGNYMYGGRIDHQVKIDGHRIELGEVEHHVRVFSESALVAAIVEQNDSLTQNTLAVYIESNKPKPEQEIIAYISRNLPPYMIPRKVCYIEKMPINLSGKIDRNALKKQKH